MPQLLSPRAETIEAHVPRACDLQQEKPPQREACVPQLEKSHSQQPRPRATKKRENFQQTKVQEQMASQAISSKHLEKS